MSRESHAEYKEEMKGGRSRETAAAQLLRQKEEVKVRRKKEW